MASFLTVITEFSDKENQRKYSIAGGTVSKPRQLIQKRVEPATPQAKAISSLDVVYGTTDPDGNVHPSKVVFGASVRFPRDALQADIDAALAVFRDFVASDQFTNMVNSQEYVQ